MIANAELRRMLEQRLMCEYSLDKDVNAPEALRRSFSTQIRALDASLEKHPDYPRDPAARYTFVQEVINDEFYSWRRKTGICMSCAHYLPNMLVDQMLNGKPETFVDDSRTILKTLESGIVCQKADLGARVPPLNSCAMYQQSPTAASLEPRNVIDEQVALWKSLKDKYCAPSSPQLQKV